MLAPIDARTVITINDEQITLRLDFQGLAMCENLGVDLFAENGIPQTITRIALVVKGLAATDHPGLTPDEALAIVSRLGPANTVQHVVEMIASFGAQIEDTEGNGVTVTTTSTSPTVN
jgi:hypothetical protein